MKKSSVNHRTGRRLFPLTWVLIFVVLALSHFLIFARLLASWQSQENTRWIPLDNITKRLQKINRGKQQSVLNVPEHHIYHGDPTKLTLGQGLPDQQRSPRSRSSTDHNTNLTIHENDPSIVKLKKLGIDIPQSEWHNIPTWNQITAKLGKEPVILGLDRCAEYRNNIPEHRRYVAPSGAFNSGTNLFPVAFVESCQQARDAVLMQVPWGKHNLVEARLRNYRINRTQYEAYRSEDALPVILVRHPISWMFSTCVHPYATHWVHDKDNCPNLINQTSGHHNAVHVGYGYRPANKRYMKYDSLIHMWKHWYKGYVSPDLPFPRLIIRLEDLVYQPDKTLHQICECVGGKKLYPNKVLPKESVKTIKDRDRAKRGLNGTLTGGRETAGLLKAWIDHANTALLWEKMTAKDQQLVKMVLARGKSKLIDLFNYKLQGS